MTARIRAGIDVARELAWLPGANLSHHHGETYRRRKDLHAELGRILEGARVPGGASPELRYLVAAMRRVAAATFSNRAGRPYAERRQALAQLRGCLEAYDRGPDRTSV